MPKSATVSTFALRWMTEWVHQRRNPKCVKTAQQRLRDHIEPVIGHIELCRLTYATYGLCAFGSTVPWSLGPSITRCPMSAACCATPSMRAS